MTPWTVAYPATPSMGFSRQEYWSGLSFPSPGDLPEPGIKPRSPTLQADVLPSEPSGKTPVTKDKFKQLLIRERRICRNKGGVVKKQYCSLGAGS